MIPHSYEMLVGIPPFYSQNQDKMFLKIKKKPVVFPEKAQLTVECKDILLKVTHTPGHSLTFQLLTKDPDKRLGTNDSEEIKNHPWFNDIDFNLLFLK